MDKQEIFDTVVRHLAQQGHRAVAKPSILSSEPVCMYRTPNGSKCAFGALIPDAVYDPRMENLRAKVLIEVGVESLYTGTDVPIPPLCKTHPWMGENAMMIEQLQVAHDNPYNPTAKTEFIKIPLYQRLEQIAVEFDLNPSVLNEVQLPEEWN